MDEMADGECYPCQNLMDIRYLDIMSNPEKWVKLSIGASAQCANTWPPVMPVPKDMREEFLYSIVECALAQGEWSRILLEVEDVGCLGQVWGWFGRAVQEVPKYTRTRGSEKRMLIHHPVSGIALAAATEYTLERNAQDLITVVSVETLNCDGQSVRVPNWASRLYHMWPSSMTLLPAPGSKCSAPSEEATLRDFQSDEQNESCEDSRSQAIPKLVCKILDYLDSSLQLVLPGSDSKFLADRILFELKDSHVEFLETSGPYFFYSTSLLSKALQHAGGKVLGKNQSLQLQMCAVAEQMRGLGFNTSTHLLETMNPTFLASSPPGASEATPERLHPVFSSDNVLKCISDVVREERCDIGLPIVRFLNALGKCASAQMLRYTLQELGADVVADIIPGILDHNRLS